MSADLILASASPRRKFLFEMMNLNFIVQPGTIEEPAPGNENPEDYAGMLSLLKASEISALNPGKLTVGADTIVVLGNQILGKPTDPEDARQMLTLLSGNTHRVITGVSAVVSNESGKIIRKTTFHVTTEVSFSPLTETEINGYISTGSPMDKAGAYGIQDDRGALFVSGISGDYYNVVGFPVNRFYQEMKTFQPDLF